MAKNNRKIRRHCVGFVGVDSGQLMLGDPCNLSTWGGNEYANNRPGEYSYAGACSTTMTWPYSGIIGTIRPREGLAAVVPTGFGDGLYPVYIDQDPEDGRVWAVTVRFDPDFCVLGDLFLEDSPGEC